MGIFVSTSGSTGWCRHFSATAMNTVFNSGGWTITFSVYVPSVSSFSADHLLAWGGATGAGASSIGTRRDSISGSAGSLFRTGGSNSIGTMSYANGDKGPVDGGTWSQVALRRATSTSILMRIRTSDGAVSNSGGVSQSTSGRETGHSCMLFYDNVTPAQASAGVGIMNLKYFAASLSDAQVDAEFAQVGAVAGAANQPVMTWPMLNTTSLTPNLTSVEGFVMTAGAGITFGANDPYAQIGGPFLLTQSSVTPVLGSMSVAGNLGVTQSRWVIPTNAAPGTIVYVHVFSGNRTSGYSHLAQGVAVVDSSKKVIIAAPTGGGVGLRTFAFVHNYNDVPTTTTIHGGPAIADGALA